MKFYIEFVINYRNTFCFFYYLVVKEKGEWRGEGGSMGALFERGGLLEDLQ